MAASGAESVQEVVLAPEAEGMVESLRGFPLDEIGTPAWYRQHEYVEKLNMQAVVSASNQRDEFVKEFLINHAKLDLIVRDLITTSVWVEKVFPQLSEMNYEPPSSFSIYLILYHEATLINLLETVLYHQEAMESIEDSVLDLADFCHDRLCYMTGTVAAHPGARENLVAAKRRNSSGALDRSSMEELQEQRDLLRFEIAVKSISILRYLTDHLALLPLSIPNRLLNTYDVPVLLASLIESPPWLVEDRPDGLPPLKYMDNAWHEVTPDTVRLLSKIEGQAWIALYQLLLNEDCQKKYELTAYRKSVLLKLRAFLTQVLLDQMPALEALQRFIEYLAVMEAPPYRKDLVIEQIPEYRERLLSEYEQRWRNLAEAFVARQTEGGADAEMRRYAANWVANYDTEALEALIDSPPKCVSCGEPATKRCSRCQNEWYCSRECQVGHWKRHKKACDLLADSLKKLQELST